MDEFELIERYLRPLGGPRPPVLLGIGDDAALVAAAGALVSAVATLPFDPTVPAGADGGQVARRVLASCRAALRSGGAEPAWMTLALTLPRPDPGWLAAFARALAESDLPLAGGDTTAGPGSVTLFLHGRPG